MQGYVHKGKSFSLPHSFGLFFSFCLLLTLTACSSKTEPSSARIEIKEIKTYAMIQAEKYPDGHPSGLTADDITSTALTSREKELFVLGNELEESLSKEQMLDAYKFYEDFLTKKRAMLESFLGRSVGYKKYVMSVFEERDLPAELACLAFVESGYNIKAKSPAKALGLWQFMPATGRAYGLKQDWWGDWRYDPYQSTHAAADYLEYLYKYFDQDWALAISAYNGGEGKIGRALKGTNTDNLHDLIQKNHRLNNKARVRKETLEYVPRLVAMTKIMLNAEELGLEPLLEGRTTPNPNVHSTLVKANTDLLALAKALDMTWEEFHLYNPALASYVSPADRLIYIHIPESKKQDLNHALAQNHEPEGWFAYTVRPNDSFTKISRLSGVPVAVLEQANPIASLKAGMQIMIPQKHTVSLPTALTRAYVPQEEKRVAVSAPVSTPATHQVAKNSTTHKVRQGDTLYRISLMYDVDLDDIYRLNRGLKAENLKPGMTIKLKATSSVASKESKGEYLVQSGDTLWSISQANNADLDVMVQLNNLVSATQIKAGQTLLLP